MFFKLMKAYEIGSIFVMCIPGIEKLRPSNGRAKNWKKTFQNPEICHKSDNPGDSQWIIYLSFIYHLSIIYIDSQRNV